MKQHIQSAPPAASKSHGLAGQQVTKLGASYSFFSIFDLVYGTTKQVGIGPRGDSSTLRKSLGMDKVVIRGQDAYSGATFLAFDPTIRANREMY